MNPTSGPAPGGIGGWLYLVALGVCLAPLRLAGEIVRGLRPLQSATWHAVTTPGTSAYHPLFAPLIVGELIVNAALLVWAVALLYLFFSKRRAFVAAMMAFLIARLAVQVADLGAGLMVPMVAARIGPAAWGGLAGGGIVVLIWVPYLVKSRRVEATFVR